MYYKILMQKSLDYLEENLRTDITPTELSEIAGFSLFHYYKVFQSLLGMPVKQFITRRKLLHSIYDISQGNKMYDIALLYGFDSYSGFYKAFKKEFHCSPSFFIKNYKPRKPYKINLMEENIIMITNKKIETLLDNWDIENKVKSNIFDDENGVKVNNVYYIGDEYVLKVTDDLGKLKNHINIAKSLKKQGLNSAYPIKNKRGEDYTADGELFYCLTNRIRGKRLTPNLIFGDLEKMPIFIGEIIGKFHKALSNVDVITENVELYDKIMEWALPQSVGYIDLNEKLISKYENEFGNLISKLPRQIIHRDAHSGNIIFDSGKWGFIDYDLSETNIRIFDICYAATSLLCYCLTDCADVKTDDWFKAYNNIINGYNSVNTLTDAEYLSMPYVILSIQLICVAYFSEQDKYKDLFDTNVKVTNWIIQNFDSLDINNYK